jgi:hypothetical protein
LPARLPVDLAPTPVTSEPPTIIDAAPALQLLGRLSTELATLTRLSPNSDACAALKDVHMRLGSAVNDGAATDVWLSTEALADQHGVAPSTVTYWCRKRKVRYRRVGNAYEIDARTVPARVQERAA